MLDEELLYSVLKENGPTLELSNECSIANGDGVVNSIRGSKRRFGWCGGIIKTNESDGKQKEFKTVLLFEWNFDGRTGVFHPPPSPACHETLIRSLRRRWRVRVPLTQ